MAEEHIYGDYKYKEINGRIVLVEYTGRGGEVELPRAIDGKPVARFGKIFSGNKSLYKIIVPDGVDKISEQAFIDCSLLHEVKLGGGVNRICELAFYGCGALTELVLPPSVRVIEDDAFAASGLKAIALNDGLTTIGENAFRASDIENIIIPDSVEFIGKSAFAATKLAALTIGRGVTLLDEYVFADTPLKRVTIPANVCGIEYAFSGCNLKEVYFEVADGWILKNVPPPDDYCSPSLLSDPKKAARCLRKGYNGREYGDRWLRLV